MNSFTHTFLNSNRDWAAPRQPLFKFLFPPNCMACLSIVIIQLLMDQNRILKKCWILQIHSPLPDIKKTSNSTFKVSRPLMEKAGRRPENIGDQNNNTGSTHFAHKLFDWNFFCRLTIFAAISKPL